MKIISAVAMLMPLGYYTVAIGGTTTAKIDGAQSTTNNGHLLWGFIVISYCVFIFFRDFAQQWETTTTTVVIIMLYFNDVV